MRSPFVAFFMSRSNHYRDRNTASTHVRFCVVVVVGDGGDRRRVVLVFLAEFCLQLKL
jgi:hypothetical protein